MDNTCPKIDHGPEIHGENAVSIAAMLEYIQLPNHPNHEWAVEAAKRFVEAERKRKFSTKPSPVPDYNPDEWDSYGQFLVYHNID